jgi:hypothetical protein
MTSYAKRMGKIRSSISHKSPGKRETCKKHLIRLINRLFEQYCKHFERY